MKFRSLCTRLLVLISFSLLCLSFVNCSKPACFYDTDCAGSQVCTNGKCAPGPVASCVSDADCVATGRRCVKSVCAFVPTGYEFPEPPPGEVVPEAKEVGPEPEPMVPEEPMVAEDAGEMPPEMPVEEAPVDTGPKACTSDADCDTNSHCQPDAAQNNQLFCQPANANGKALGEACTANADCSTNLCRPDKSRCTKVCQTNADCPQGSACEEVDFGNGLKLNVCFSGGNQCARDGDCSGKTCFLFKNQSQKVVETICRDPLPNTKEAGTSCSRDTDCASNVCLDSVCSRLCAADTDCRPGYVCQSRDFEVDGAKFPFKVCAISPDGIPCEEDSHCLRDNHICLPKADQGKLIMRCLPSNNSGVADGKDCTKNTDCNHQICLAYSKTCAVPCQTSCLGGLSCSSVAVDYDSVQGSLKYCIPARSTCTTKSDCAAGEVCAAQVDDTGKFTLSCFPENTNGTKIGDSCNNAKPEDCGSLICVLSRCSQPCAAVSDCPTGYECTAQTLTAPNQTPISTKLCTVPGAGLSCASDANCTSSSEICRIVENNNQLELRCQSAGSGSKKEGEDCTQDSDCLSGTCMLPDGLCTKPCSKDADCAGGLLCLKRSFKSSSGASFDFNVCTFKVCTGNLDCKSDEVCIYKAGSNQDYVLTCQKANTNKAEDGKNCQADTDCRSNLCHPNEKVCVPPCEDGKSSSCPLQFSCETTATGPNQLKLCVPVQKGCLTDAGCTQNEICTLFYDSDKRPVRTCSTAKGSLKLGDACDPQRTDQCQTGLCDPATLRCSQFCDASSQSPCPSPYTCSPAKLGSATLSICRRCRYDKDCNAGEVCKVSLDTNTNLFKQCGTAATGAKKYGDACNSSLGFGNQCVNLLCTTSNRCQATCEAHRHCADTERCTTVRIGTKQTQGCVTGTRPDCGGDSDCPQPTGGRAVCKMISTGSTLKKICATITAPGKKVGDTCTPGITNGCENGICDSVTKKCLAPCEPGFGDCGQGEVCGEFTATGQTNSVFACIQPPSPCKKQSECATGTTCAVQVSGRQVDYLCLRTPGSLTDVGAACTRESDCKTGLCHPSLKVCVATCEVDGDCTNSARSVCGKIELSSGPLARACIPKDSPCSHDAVCPASQPVCGLDLNTSGAIIKKCITPASGKIATGQACSDNRIPGDCQNRFCELGTRKCTPACEKDEHCAQGLVCATTTVEGKSVKGCVPARGALCQRKTDCALPNYCTASRSATGINTTCQAKSRRDEGAECDSAKSIAQSDCASRLCSPTSDLCTSVCSVDTDCDSGTCKSATIEGFSIKVCNNECTSNSDCPSSQPCTVTRRANGTIQTLCQVPDAQKAATGAACDPTKNLPGDCANGFCDLVTSKCVDVCNANSDCGSGQLCLRTFVKFNTTYSAIRGCVPEVGSCRYPGDCFNNMVCRAQVANAKGTLNCATPASGGLKVGDTCDPAETFPGKCETRLCDSESKECTIPCRNDADCAAFTTRKTCGTITVNATAISACIQPPPTP